MTNIEIKKPSPELVSLVKAASSSLTGFMQLWESIRKKGHDEGFSDEELTDMIMPLVKDKLTKAQVQYLTHQEQEKERAKQNRAKQKQELEDLRKKKSTYVQPNDDKKEPEDLDTESDVPVTTLDKPIYKDEGTQYEEQYKKEVAKIESIRAMPRPEPEINPLDIVVVGRYGLFEPEKTAQALSKDLSKVNLGRVKKWKVVEISARYIS